MAQTAVIGIVGLEDTTSLLVNRFAGISSPSEEAVLPPNLASPYKGLDSFRLHYVPSLRTLFVQLSTPDFISAEGFSSCTDHVRHRRQEKLHFLTAALHLFLSCHTVVWALPSSTIPATFLHQLRLLQAAKKKADSSAASFPAWPSSNSLASPPPRAVRLLVAVTALSQEEAHSSALEKQVNGILEYLAAESGGGSCLCQTGGLLAEQPLRAFRIPEPFEYKQSLLSAALQALAGTEEGEKGSAAAQLQRAPLGEPELKLFREAVLASIKALHQPPVNLPSLQSWCKKARSLREFLGLGVSSQLLESEATDLASAVPKIGEGVWKAALHTLLSGFDPAFRFSLAKCRSALEKGFSEYQRGLPLRFAAQRHHGALQRALKLFYAHARGTEAESYAARLQRDCELFWTDGRQLCGALSLSGNPCILPPHRSRPEDTRAIAAQDLAADSSAEALERRHHSGVVFEVADITGAHRQQVADPFAPDDLVSQLQPGGAVEGASVRRLAMRLCFTDGGGDVQEKLVGWAFLSTFDGWEGKGVDLGLWTEGFAAGQGQLQSMALPRLEAQPEPRTSASHAPKEAGEKLRGAAIDLDLEFPPLLVANEAPKATADKRKQGQSRSAREDARRREDTAYRELVAAGWPGVGWAAAGDDGAPASQGPKRRIGKQMGRGHDNPDPAASEQLPKDRIFLGLEYETLQGKRWLLSPDLLPDSLPPKSAALPWLLSRDLPLWVQLPGVRRERGKSKHSRDALSGSTGEKGGKGELAQLARIWVVPPPPPLSFSLRPLLRFEVGSGGLVQLQLVDSPELPPGSLSVLRLPMMYAVPEGWLSEQDQDGSSGRAEQWHPLLPAALCGAVLSAGTALVPV